MFLGPKRRRSIYPLNIRRRGTTIFDHWKAAKLRRISASYEHTTINQLSAGLVTMNIALLASICHLYAHRNAVNPVWQEIFKVCYTLLE